MRNRFRSVSTVSTCMPWTYYCLPRPKLCRHGLFWSTDLISARGQLVTQKPVCADGQRHQGDWLLTTSFYRAHWISHKNQRWSRHDGPNERKFQHLAGPLLFGNYEKRRNPTSQVETESDCTGPAFSASTASYRVALCAEWPETVICLPPLLKGARDQLLIA